LDCKRGTSTNTNSLSLNIEKNVWLFTTLPQIKYKTTSIGGRQKRLVFDGVSTNKVTGTKLFGIVIDEHLTWTQYANLIDNKIAKKFRRKNQWPNYNP